MVFLSNKFFWYNSVELAKKKNQQGIYHTWYELIVDGNLFTLAIFVVAYFPIYELEQNLCTNYYPNK